MTRITTIGLDLAKKVFQIHGVDAEGKVAVARKLRRKEVLVFFAKLPLVWSAWRRAAARTGHVRSPSSDIP
jgi:transposase